MKLHTDLPLDLDKTGDVLMAAWGLIANAYEGNWDRGMAQRSARLPRQFLASVARETRPPKQVGASGGYLNVRSGSGGVPGTRTVRSLKPLTSRRPTRRDPAARTPPGDAQDHPTQPQPKRTQVR